MFICLYKTAVLTILKKPFVTVPIFIYLEVAMLASWSALTQPLLPSPHYCPHLYLPWGWWGQPPDLYQHSLLLLLPPVTVLTFIYLEVGEVSLLLYTDTASVTIPPLLSSPLFTLRLARSASGFISSQPPSVTTPNYRPYLYLPWSRWGQPPALHRDSLLLLPPQITILNLYLPWSWQGQPPDLHRHSLLLLPPQITILYLYLPWSWRGQPPDLHRHSLLLLPPQITILYLYLPWSWRGQPPALHRHSLLLLPPQITVLYLYLPWGWQGQPPDLHRHSLS